MCIIDVCNHRRQVASARDLEHEFERMLGPFEGRESEQNWQLRDQNISKIRGMRSASLLWPM
jgi:hypothetical protein